MPGSRAGGTCDLLDFLKPKAHENVPRSDRLDGTRRLADHIAA
jgi:hypothetical protein